MIAFGSRAPNGLARLKTSCARQSQKLRLLKTALIIVGVLRGSTLRTLISPMWKPSGSATERHTSGTLGTRLGLFKIGVLPTAVNLRLNTPAEPTTSLLSWSKVDPRRSVVASRWLG